MPKIYTEEKKQEFRKRLLAVKEVLPYNYTSVLTGFKRNELTLLMNGKSMNFNLLKKIEKKLAKKLAK